MVRFYLRLLPLILLLLLSRDVINSAVACSDGQRRRMDKCCDDGDCGAGLHCSSCLGQFLGSRCVRSAITDPFALLNNSLPFNKYAFLTTHNAYAIAGERSHTGIPRVTFKNQEDTVTQQLNNGVRALMLDTYDFDGDVWLCHSFKGQCHDYTAFEPALDTLKEIEAFLSRNPKAIVTIILEDYVHAPNGLTKVFTAARLMKYWFPVANMPKNGQDWPLVSDMVASNYRLLVFTSISSKEQSEGIAYQWNYMVENQYGDGGVKGGSCANRAESSQLDDKTKSLVLVNFFPSVPIKGVTCHYNSARLINMLKTCHGTAGNRWANFIAVDYYKRCGRGGGGSFQAVDMLNGELLCGCDDVHACVVSSNNLNHSKGLFNDRSELTKQVMNRFLSAARFNSKSLLQYIVAGKGTGSRHAGEADSAEHVT